ncbi:hypothetical protein KGF56_004338 [Candida oxycetoniae]|uniref:Phosphoglucomutase n=1 Tax=Candida oxycetoniae TaxID=497107 RepID=A0AAI9STQ2_9ASCO|nr:uncharacterized protein KGF56_004338 [Candida oxycetoniae]KAI3402877.2 hypothetical protein KGF56_004338 [Candida oxycetoniae]
MNTVSRAQLDNLVQDWLSIDPNPQTRAEIQQLQQEQDYEKLVRKLYPRITFGTAGLRSSMESGFAHMNDVTVLQASQGLVQFLCTKFDNPSIVIGYDHRYHSQRYAELLASVALIKGITVYYLGSAKNLSLESLRLSKGDFPNNSDGAAAAADRGYVHTPIVPFAINQLHASGGVMITASHNPAMDNGYKVYYSNGCQIIPPIDHEISESINANLKPWSENVWDVTGNMSQGLKNGQLKPSREEIVKKYVDSVKSKLVKDTDKNLGFNFVYTPMHGVGLEIFEKCLQLFDIDKYEVVSKQAVPDPAFPTVSFPNPEEKGALDLAIATAKKLGYKLVLANDPDADRFSVAAENKNGEFKQLTGNEIGFLFAMYVLENIGSSENDLSKVCMLNSTVSSQILKAMAEKDGFHYADTLTGFKWIGNKAIDMEKEGFFVPFAFEEAIGFMFNIVHDKDGVSAAVVFLQLFQQWFSSGEIDVFDKLEDGYKKYGWFKDLNGYYRIKDLEVTDRVFGEIRKSYKGQNFPQQIGDFKVVYWRDLTVGYDSCTNDHKPTLLVDAKSQMITGVLEPVFDGIMEKDAKLSVRFTCRGSGTEPKLKVYIEGTSTKSEADATSIADKCWETLKANWFKPDFYKLQEIKP